MIPKLNSVIGTKNATRVKSAYQSIRKFANKYFTESGRSKSAGLKPLKGKERDQFIRETSMYDPNSPDYIHANYSVSKKSK